MLVDLTHDATWLDELERFEGSLMHIRVARASVSHVACYQ